jgi:presenilin-like A22 family membrane protease
MQGHKLTFYSISVILSICSAVIAGLALYVDSEGYVMAAQTLMLLSGVIAIWGMTSLLAGKG